MKAHHSLLLSYLLLLTLAIVFQQQTVLAEADHDHDHDLDEHHDEDELYNEDAYHDEVGDHDEHAHEHEDGDIHGDVHDGEGDKPWAEVIGSTLLVNVTTLAGLISLIPTFAKAGRFDRLAKIGIPSFAGGALIATSLFLIFPESFELLDTFYSNEHSDENLDGHDEESGGHDDNKMVKISLQFGFSFLAGFLLPTLLGIAFHKSTSSDEQSLLVMTNNEVTVSHGVEYEGGSKISREQGHECDLCEDSVTDKEGGAKCEQVSITIDEEENKKKKKSVLASFRTTPFDDTATVINTRLCSTILIGDSFHNISDGIFIGTAFRLCSASTAWTIVVATIYHELVQELADFFLLTRNGGLSTYKALMLNFLSGISVVVGGIIVLLIDINDSIIASILVMAGGVYFHIAMESMSQLEKHSLDTRDRLLSVAFFFLGMLPIVGVATSHRHCESGHDH